MPVDSISSIYLPIYNLATTTWQRPSSSQYRWLTSNVLCPGSSHSSKHWFYCTTLCTCTQAQVSINCTAIHCTVLFCSLNIMFIVFLKCCDFFWTLPVLPVMDLMPHDGSSFLNSASSVGDGPDAIWWFLFSELCQFCCFWTWCHLVDLVFLTLPVLLVMDLMPSGGSYFLNSVSSAVFGPDATWWF